jgi:hypothetical protein
MEYLHHLITEILSNFFIEQKLSTDYQQLQMSLSLYAKALL